MKNHPHPGELIREDVLLPLGIEVTDAAHRLGMSRTALFWGAVQTRGDSMTCLALLG
jgi:hypothetical protein